MEIDYHVHRYNEVTKELSRLAEQAKKLRIHKKDAQKKLYEQMEKYGYESYKGIKRSKIAPPKERKKSKNKNQRQKDAVALLSSLGIHNSEEIWNRIENEKL
ncbi:MAG TPA: hypothetical protein VLE02_01540 [Nitrosarchaeum sp.]|nr:hypothetical protein [Nitrosarchaeum sp.]